MNIRSYDPADIQQIVTLFYETIHAINRRDYTQAQLDAWAPKEEKPLLVQSLHDSLSRQIAYVAELDEQIVGFADLTLGGRVDRLFTHKDYKGQGVAAALLSRLEAEAIARGIPEMDTEASITAKPFFERHGFRVAAVQTIQRRGVNLTNYRMIKPLDS